MIQCNCTDDGGAVYKYIRWFDPIGVRLLSPEHRRFMDGIPHFIRILKEDDSNVVLVIPLFNDSYDGLYTCGVQSSYPPGKPNATVNLFIGGKLMINKLLKSCCTVMIILLK